MPQISHHLGHYSACENRSLLDGSCRTLMMRYIFTILSLLVVRYPRMAKNPITIMYTKRDEHTENLKNIHRADLEDA